MPVKSSEGYIDLKYKPDYKHDLICSFYIVPAEGMTIAKAAENVASESSIGTWTDVATMSPRIKKLGAKVYEIKGNWVKIAYPEQLFEAGNMPEILSSIAGNVFGMKAVASLRLEDVEWPYEIMKAFKGPVFGIPGIRKIVRVPKRPLTGTIVKPKLGLNEKEHARVAYDAWVGGVDIVKDDENLSSMKFNKFQKRLDETMKMRDKAEKETGERKMYMPNVTAETFEMLKRAKAVKKSGNEYLMVDIITTGWAGLQTLRNANDDLKLVLHAHRAGHAAFTRGHHGIAMLVIADAARLIGLDQIHIGTVVGKMEGDKTEVQHIDEEIEHRFIKANGHTLAEDWHHIKPVFAVCSGGLHPGHVPRLVKYLGKDIIIQMGGGIHGHPLGTVGGAKAARQAVDAVIKGMSLHEYAKKHKELKMCLDKWGTV
jgi:ribulose-bisphosphate carboxylase large chain